MTSPDHRAIPVWFHRLNGYAAATLMVAGALGLAALLPTATANAVAALVLLVPVWATALLYGWRSSVLAAVEAAFAYNFFFIPPLYTFVIADWANMLAFLIFMAVATSGSLLATRLRDARLTAETERLSAALLASISHDLKTPLASILGTVTSLRSTVFDDTARQEMLGEIQEEANRLHRFITNLLDMTRLESCTIRPRCEPCDLADIAGSALRRAVKLLEPRRVVVDIPADLPLADADPVLMEQVLFNLLDNAAKYTPAESKLTIRAGYTAGRVMLHIIDEGPGLGPQDPARLFGKFYRGLPGATHSAGTGLGLAICRGFIETMGGTITAANCAGRPGAMFTISLPSSPTFTCNGEGES